MNSNIKTKITDIMTFQPKTRDNVGLLAVYYANAYMDKNHKLTDFAKVVLTIDRLSRQLQRDYLELRGEKWAERQKKGKQERIIRSRQQERPEDLSKLFSDTFGNCERIEVKKSLLNTITFGLWS